MENMSLLDFMILNFLATEGEKKYRDVLKYVEKIMEISKQRFSYRIKTLYKRRLIRQKYYTSINPVTSEADITTYYCLTEEGKALYKKNKSALKRELSLTKKAV